MRAGSKFFLIFLILFVLSISHCLIHETAVQASQYTEKELREKIRLNPNDAEAHYNFGNLLQDLKRYEEAEKEYREAIRINPNIAGVHANFGLLYKSINKKDEAKREFLIARELFEKQNRTEEVRKVDELLNDLK